jgi:hypothetical protein
MKRFETFIYVVILSMFGLHYTLSTWFDVPPRYPSVDENYHNITNSHIYYTNGRMFHILVEYRKDDPGRVRTVSESF